VIANLPFDRAAQNYDAIVQRAIGASGETVQFFAELKVRLTAETVGDAQPETILDFGCGIGNTTRAIATRFPNSDVVGFDVSTDSLALARQLASSPLGRVTYVSSSDNRLPLPDASVALVFASCVFHHIEPDERERWARELKRVLKPGAPVFLFEHNPYNPLTRRVVRRVPFDESVILLKPRDATSLMRSAGFTTSPARFYFFFPSFIRALRALEPALRRIPLGAQYFVVGR